jgi:hypothetical protein
MAYSTGTKLYSDTSAKTTRSFGLKSGLFIKRVLISFSSLSTLAHLMEVGLAKLMTSSLKGIEEASLDASSF